MKSQVTLRSGSEGPKHDPYGYQEITVTQGNVRVTGHIGLGLWIEDNITSRRMRFKSIEAMEVIFKELTGDTAENWIEKYEEEHRNDIEDPMGCLADYE